MAETGNMICPKCQAFQPKAPVCKECGVVVAKLAAPAPSAEPERMPAPEPRRSTGGGGLRVPAIAFVVLAVTGVAAYALSGFGDSESALDRELRGVEIIDVLRENDPSAYEGLKALLRTSIRQGDSKQEMVSRVQAYSAGLMSRYLPRASDDAVDDFAHELLRVMDTARAEDPTLCYYLLYPRFYEREDLRNFLVGEFNEDFAGAMASVIRTATREPQSPPDPQRSEELLRGAVLPLADEFGDDIRLFGQSTHDRSERKKVCTMGRAMYKRILLLSHTNASMVLRHMATVQQ